MESRRPYDILVLGELNADLILSGPDVTPVFGQAEKLVQDATLALGSSSAIFACGASRLGLHVGFLGKVGDDDLGRFVLRVLEDRGVDTSPVQIDPNVKTGITVHLSPRPGGDRAMLTYPGSIAALTGGDVDRERLAQARHVHVGSFFLQTGLQPALPEIAALARAAGTSVSIDPGWDPAERWDGGLEATLAHTDVFLPNEQEALAIVRAGGAHIANPSAALDQLAAQVPVVAIKQGAQGAQARRGAERAQCAGFRVNAVDSTGAGDSFDAGLLYGYLNGFDLETCLKWGCACGALAASRIGGIEGQPTVQEARALIESQTGG